MNQVQEIEIFIPDIEVENNFVLHRTNKIDTMDKNQTTYSDFFCKYMVKNVPCVIKNISTDWACTEKWIENDVINTKHFSEKYGELDVPVADCNNTQYNAHSKTEMKVCDFMNYLEQGDKANHILYLKDWHLRRLKKDDPFYEVPVLFSSDWLNELALDRGDDDFMFVYIGPKDSWTPLHVDVYNSYSWSVNIIGRKQWILFPPGEENKLKDHLGNLPMIFDPDKFEGIQHFIVIQEKGDAIFVPSGWHHQVINMLDTISVNHNWINACNISKVWTALNDSLLSVENEIIEFKNTPEYLQQCQLILKSLFGLDFVGFVDFLCHIGKKRVLQSNEQTILYFDKFILGKNHLLFDFKALKTILYSIKTHTLFISKYLSPNLEKDVTDLIESISQITH